MKKAGRFALLLLAAFLFLMPASCSTPAGAKPSTGEGENQMDAAAPPVNVEIRPVSLASLKENIVVSGDTEANTRVTYAAEVAGRIEYLSADLGDRVKKGKALARIGVDGRYTTPGGKQLGYRIEGPRGNRVSEGALSLNEFGSGFGELALDESMVLGPYRVIFTEGRRDRTLGSATLLQAKEARMSILDVMENTIAQSRAEVSPYAPRMYQIKINPDKIGAVIGSGGNGIRLGRSPSHSCSSRREVNRKRARPPRAARRNSTSSPCSSTLQADSLPAGKPVTDSTLSQTQSSGTCFRMSSATSRRS